MFDKKIVRRLIIILSWVLCIFAVWLLFKGSINVDRVQESIILVGVKTLFIIWVIVSFSDIWNGEEDSGEWFLVPFPLFLAYALWDKKDVPEAVGEKVFLIFAGMVAFLVGFVLDLFYQREDEE